VRLYAEDPEAGFLPGSGRLQRLLLPVGDEGVRIDSGVVEGDVVSIFYDPMIAKLIVHAADRDAALARLRAALAACVVEGPKSNIAFLERLVRHPAVVEGRIDTGYLDRHLDEFTGDDDAHAQGRAEARAAAAVAMLLAAEAEARCAAAGSDDPGSPWAIADGWRLGHAGLRRVVLGEGPARHVAVAHGSGGDYRIAFEDARPLVVDGAAMAGGVLHARFDGRGLRFPITANGTGVLVHDGRRRWHFERIAAYEATRSAQAGGGNRVAAPMPGRIVVTRVAPGERVSEGQELLVMEAMKMELALKAPRDGVVAELLAREGDFVDADAVLVTLED
jgi:3-methylcrotonyl-CoA carboxylase alpha subunit